MKLSLGDNLHETSEPIFWGKKKKKRKIINLSSAELEKLVVKAKNNNNKIKSMQLRKMGTFLWVGLIMYVLF